MNVSRCFNSPKTRWFTKGANILKLFVERFGPNIVLTIRQQPGITVMYLYLKEIVILIEARVVAPAALHFDGIRVRK